MFYMPKVMRMFAIVLLLHIRQDQRDRRTFWRLNGILVDPRDDFHNTNNIVSLSKGKLDEQAENIDTILKKVDTMQNEECKLDDIFKSNSHLPYCMNYLS
jgi:hypothetical protein